MRTAFVLFERDGYGLIHGSKQTHTIEIKVRRVDEARQGGINLEYPTANQLKAAIEQASLTGCSVYIYGDIKEEEEKANNGKRNEA